MFDGKDVLPKCENTNISGLELKLCSITDFRN